MDASRVRVPELQRRRADDRRDADGVIDAGSVSPRPQKKTQRLADIAATYGTDFADQLAADIAPGLSRRTVHFGLALHANRVELRRGAAFLTAVLSGTSGKVPTEFFEALADDPEEGKRQYEEVEARQQARKFHQTGEF